MRLELFSLILLCLVIGTRSAALGENYSPYLLVVGDVTNHSARILHEQLASSSSGHYYSSVFVLPQTVPQLENTWQVQPYPQVQSLENLEANTTYRVCFQQNSAPRSVDACGSDFVQFTTFSSSPGELQFSVVSCNRFAEDGDDFMWNQLQQTHLRNLSSHSGTFHLGDQIYADWIPRQFVASQEKEVTEGQCVPFQALVDYFRYFYRKTWDHAAMNSTLRLGPNWMIPDDHEIINNANPDYWNGLLQPPKQPHLTRAFIKYFMRAGVQSFLEYQHQLMRDVPRLPQEVMSCCLPFDGQEVSDSCLAHFDAYDQQLFTFVDQPGFRFFTEIGRTAILMLDTRYERTLLSHSPREEEHPWLGSTQFEHLVKELSRLEAKIEDIDHVLIFTGMPVYFSSRFLARLAYWVEGEKYSTHPDLEEDLGQMMELLFRSPLQDKFILLSGDLHMYFESEVCDSYSGKCIPQVITSGMTVGSTALYNMSIFTYYIFAFGLWRPWHFTRTLLLSIQYSSMFLANNFVLLSLDGPNASFFPYWKPLLTWKDRLAHGAFDWNLTIAVMTVLVVMAALSGLVHCLCGIGRRRPEDKYKEE